MRASGVRLISAQRMPMWTQVCLKVGDLSHTCSFRLGMHTAAWNCLLALWWTIQQWGTRAQSTILSKLYLTPPVLYLNYFSPMWGEETIPTVTHSPINHVWNNDVTGHSLVSLNLITHYLALPRCPPLRLGSSLATLCTRALGMQVRLGALSCILDLYGNWLQT